MIKDIEKKRAELIHFIKTVGAPHIWSTYNFYLKEIGCEALIPEGSQDDLHKIFSKHLLIPEGSQDDQ